MSSCQSEYLRKCVRGWVVPCSPAFCKNMASEHAHPPQLRLLGSSFHGSPHDRASQSRGTDSSASDETEWQLHFLGPKGAGWRRRVPRLGVSLVMLLVFHERVGGWICHPLSFVCQLLKLSQMFRCKAFVLCFNLAGWTRTTTR